jgi:hypothetical protein
MRTPFRPDAITFENMKNWPGRPDSAVNFVMYFDLMLVTHLSFNFKMTCKYT